METVCWTLCSIHPSLTSCLFLFLLTFSDKCEEVVDSILLSNTNAHTRTHAPSVARNLWIFMVLNNYWWNIFSACRWLRSVNAVSLWHVVVSLIWTSIRLLWEHLCHRVQTEITLSLHCLVLQELVKQFSCSAVPGHARLPLIYAVAMPPRWAIEVVSWNMLFQNQYPSAVKFDYSVSCMSFSALHILSFEQTLRTIVSNLAGKYINVFSLAVWLHELFSVISVKQIY